MILGHFVANCKVKMRQADVLVIAFRSFPLRARKALTTGGRSDTSLTGGRFYFPHPTSNRSSSHLNQQRCAETERGKRRNSERCRAFLGILAQRITWAELQRIQELSPKPHASKGFEKNRLNEAFQ